MLSKELSVKQWIIAFVVYLIKIEVFSLAF